MRNRDEKTDERRKSGSKPSRDGLDFLMPVCVPTTYMAWTRGNIDSSCLFRGGAWISLPRISPPPAQGDTDTAAVLRAQREPVACIPGSLRWGRVCSTETCTCPTRESSEKRDGCFQLLLADFMIHGGPTYWWILEGSRTAIRERRCNRTVLYGGGSRNFQARGLGFVVFSLRGTIPTGRTTQERYAPRPRAFQRGPSLNGPDEGGSGSICSSQERGFIQGR